MQDRTAFLEERKTLIGGSDVAAFFGISPHRSEHQVYLEKTGQEEEDDSPKPWLRIGQVVEPAILTLFCEQTGLRVETVEDAFRHPEHPFIGGHVDGLAYNGSDVPVIFEAKNVGLRMAKHWSKGGDDHIPDFYNLQVQHYMMVVSAALGKPISEAHVAALVGGNEFRTYTVQGNERIQQAILEKCVAFWNNHVLPGVPPTVDGSEGATEMLSTLYPQSTEGEMEASGNANLMIARLMSLIDGRDTINEQIRECQNVIKDELGIYQTMIGEKARVKWSNVSRDTVAWKKVVAEAGIDPALIEKHTKTSESRRFSMTAIKEAK